MRKKFQQSKRQVLGAQEEQGLPPLQLEVIKEHLEVHRAHRIRDVATGKVILNKIKTNLTYLATTNYWAPIYDELEEDKQP